MVLVERVSRLEEMFARFLGQTERVMTAFHEEVAEIRISNLRTDRILLEMQRQADRSREQAEKERQQADKERQQADKERRQAERDRKDFNRRLAEVTDAQGLMIENMVWPNLTRIAREVFQGEQVMASGIRIKRRRPTAPGENMEIDLLAAGSSKILICEAKSKIDGSAGAAFLRKLKPFADYFPEYTGYRVIPVMASIAFNESVLKRLTSLGIYALGFGGETMQLLNAAPLRRR